MPEQDDRDPIDRALSGDHAAYAEAVSLIRARENLRQFRPEPEPDLPPKIAAAFRAHEDALSQIADHLETWTRAAPSNWPPNRLDEGITFIEQTRWPIVWVPRQQVVDQLLDSVESERPTCLLRLADEVIDDCLSILTQVTSARYAESVGFAESALKAYRDGHSAPAQALAAALVTTVVQHHLRYGTLGEAARDLAVEPREVDFGAIRIALISGCVPDVFSNFWPAKGDPVPVTFNRHASLHRVSSEQYTRVNALVGLIFVCALLRELSHLEETGRWTPDS